MMLLTAILSGIVLTVRTCHGRRLLQITKEHIKDPSNLKSINLVSRLYIPYGPDLASDPPQRSDEQPYRGYGYGMEAVDRVIFDPVNHYLYSVSLRGFLVVSDWADPTKPQVSSLSINLGRDFGEVPSMEVRQRSFRGDNLIYISDSLSSDCSRYAGYRIVCSLSTCWARTSQKTKFAFITQSNVLILHRRCCPTRFVSASGLRLCYSQRTAQRWLWRTLTVRTKYSVPALASFETWSTPNPQYQPSSWMTRRGGMTSIS